MEVTKAKSVAGIISIPFPHFPAEIQRTDWLQKVRPTQHADFAEFAGAKLKNLLAKWEGELQFSLKKSG